MARKFLSQAIATLSTHNAQTYYPSAWGFFHSLLEVLAQYGYTCDPPILYNDIGHTTVEATHSGEKKVWLWVSWYRMPSYNWEFTTYLA